MKSAQNMNVRSMDILVHVPNRQLESRAQFLLSTLAGTDALHALNHTPPTMSDEVSAEFAFPTELSKLSAVIDEKPESFASGDDAIREAALHAAKFIFDLSEFGLAFKKRVFLSLYS